MTLALQTDRVRFDHARSGRPLAVCYGTRPQVIKASILVEELSHDWPVLTMDTGQHYDYELNALLYQQLGIRSPDVLLGVGSADHAEQTSAVMTGAARVFAERRPWAVIVIGDTNSTLGCALAAAKMRIPVVHVEAGLRARDALMAEELNRRMVDAISSVLCAPCDRAAARLRAEHAGGQVFLTGDIARDVLLRHGADLPTAWSSATWPLEPERAFAFATLHRAELTSDPVVLRAVLQALGQLPLPVVLATHPRTRAVIERERLESALSESVRLCSPFGYLETLACVRDASVVVTDSGGVQREAYWLGTPCITMRSETEWTETVELSANTLLDARHDSARLPSVAETLLGNGTTRAWNRDAYGTGDAAGRIALAVRELAAAQVSR